MAAPQCGQRKDLLRWARVFLFFKMVISYNIVTVEGAAASRVFFHLKAEAVRMGEKMA